MEMFFLAQVYSVNLTLILRAYTIRAEPILPIIPICLNNVVNPPAHVCADSDEIVCIE